MSWPGKRIGARDGHWNGIPVHLGSAERCRQPARLVVCAVVATFASGAARAEEPAAWALTGYVGRITSVNAWHDIVTEPNHVEFADAYLATLAVSHTLARYHQNDVGLEAEGQVVYNFGDQSNWEFNALLATRWHRFPWNETVATTMAFGLGLSYATEVPEVEIELEDSSQQLLIYWVWEMTFAPPGARWGASLRLHHRSTGFGLMAEDGGMNAIALGLRFEF
jgi:hypothetical protein